MPMLSRLGISCLWNSSKRHDSHSITFFQENALSELIGGVLRADPFFQTRWDDYYYSSFSKEIFESLFNHIYEIYQNTTRYSYIFEVPFFTIKKSKKMKFRLANDSSYRKKWESEIIQTTPKLSTRHDFMYKPIVYRGGGLNYINQKLHLDLKDEKLSHYNLNRKMSKILLLLGSDISSDDDSDQTDEI